MKNVLILPNRMKGIPEEAIAAIGEKLKSWGCIPSVFEIPEAGESSSHLEGADLLVVLGGDGTIIDVARTTAGMNVPIVGINYGSVGYMAEIAASDTDKLKMVIDGDYTIQNRMMLDVAVIRDGLVIHSIHPALNDAVLSNGPIPRLVSFEMYCDGLLAQKCRADGIIISTPTGSSAYSMSAGGPIMDPCLECISTTPICPYLQNEHPVIFMPQSVIELRNPVCRDNNIYLSVDGKEVLEVQSGDIIRICKSRYSAPLVRIGNKSFIDTLNSKLSGNA